MGLGLVLPEANLFFMGFPFLETITTKLLNPTHFFRFFGWVWPGFLGWPNPWTPLEAGTDARDAYREFCSLPKCFCSLPSEMTKMPLRDLPHAACCDKPRQNLISNLKSLSNYPTPKFLQLQIKQHSNNKNK